MSRVRARGNRSTEWRLRSALMREGIRGWELHVRSLPGVPDIVFERTKLAIFIDGCFWHACSRCARPLPITNHEYWVNKIQGNQRRARNVNRALRASGFHVIRVWEHELRSPSHVRRIVTRVLRRVKEG